MDHSGRKPSAKTCEKCGSMFACGASESSCWCDAVKLSAEALAQLRATYRDCLCPECLPSFANVKAAP
jgi:hypothetical protein